MSRDAARARADADARERLLDLVPEADRDGVGEPGAVDRLFARTVWSRLVEPGDAVSGAVIAALGPARALELLASRSPEQEILAAMRDAGERGAVVTEADIAAGLRRWTPRLNRSESLADLDRARARGMRIITPESVAWPAQLDALGEHAPLMLWARGGVELLTGLSLAIVGARACTGYGTHITAELGDAACAAGVTLVSGAAYGIDAVVHRTALAAGAPTVAVLAGGADRAYPAAHASLLGRIAETGLVCSEMVPGSAPTRWRFLQRNRVIAALARATLVTEAGVRSGSLNTAGHAAEIGRALGAVPGPVTSAASTGCHRLIREYGAALVTNGDDLLELLEIDAEALLFGADPRDARRGAGPGRQPALHRRVLDALPLRGRRTIAEVARRSGVAVEEARDAMAELELLGHVARRETPEDAEPQWSLKKRE